MPEPGTDRVEILRKQTLGVIEQKILCDLENYPCSVVQIAKEAGVPGWAFTPQKKNC